MSHNRRMKDIKAAEAVRDLRRKARDLRTLADHLDGEANLIARPGATGAVRETAALLCAAQGEIAKRLHMLDAESLTKIAVEWAYFSGAASGEDDS